MAISLTKGQKISLDKVAPGLVAAFAGLGWDVKATGGGDHFDLDASTFMLGANEKLGLRKSTFIFYNNRNSPDPDQSVRSMGDNRTGSGEGDDEVIIIDLRKVPAEVQKVVFVVTIYQGEERGQNFGQVRNAYVRLVNVQSKEEVLRYDLSEDFSVETAIVMAELYRKDSEWQFSAVGSGYQGGLQALLDRYS